MSAPKSSMVPCAHCGLPAPPAPHADDPAFCCVGCEAIYHAIHAGGFENFYKLKGIGNQGATPRGVDRRDAQFSYLDSEEFLEHHTDALADGRRRVQLHLEGVHCAGCVWLTEKMPFHVDGIEDAKLSLARGRLDLRWDPNKVALSHAAKWLAQFGFMPHPLNKDRIEGATTAERELLKRVGASWAISGNIMIMAVAGYGGLNMLKDPMLSNFMRWVSLLLATISMLYGGAVFFRRAFTSVRSIFQSHGERAWMQLSMDVPIALGLFVGWLHSAIATIRGTGDVWFDSIAVLIAALLTARWLQMRGRRYAGEATERMLSLLPTTARRLSTTGALEEIPAEQLAAGDVIEVRAGDVVAADGIVEHGESTLFRAVVSGESRPEPIGVGQAIDAGVTNLGAVLHVRVHAAGNDTRIGQLMQWVEEGDRRRAPVVQLADTLGGLFVLVVLAAALLTGIVWSILSPEHAISHVVALLVISCPCALGMATPLALTVGVGRAAKHGIFIKHDDVLQSLARATHIFFDKTGTLTEGQMTVGEVIGDEDAAHLAAVLEIQSVHPISNAITQWARRHAEVWPPPSPAQDVTEVAGAGIEGTVDGHHVAIGRRSWLVERGVRTDLKPWAHIEQDIATRGGSPVFIAVDNVLRCALYIGDAIREDTPALLDALRADGIHVGLLSGDHPQLVSQCAQALDIPTELTHGGVTPEGKRDLIAQLRKDTPDAVIVMIGDGVNDAVAMQEADVGVAVHDGAQAALVAADIFVTQEGVAPIGVLLHGTRDVMRTVRRNLMGSALYNAIGISAAALGVVVPLVAAVAMPFSSLFVITSSLLQRSFDAGAQTTGVAESHASPASPSLQLAAEESG